MKYFFLKRNTGQAHSPIFTKRLGGNHIQLRQIYARSIIGVHKKLVGGQAMIIGVLFFMFASITLIYGVSVPLLSEIRSFGSVKNSNNSFFTAEAALEDVVLRVKQGQAVSASNLLLNDAEAAVEVGSVLGGKEIISLGDSNNRLRKSKVLLTLGDGAAFNFGIQTGNGGFVLGGNAGVYGNVYSNGSITGANGSFITGSAITVGTSTITNVDIGQDGEGDAHSNAVFNSSIAGSLYCKTGSGNNKPCDTSRDNALPQPFPISEAQIQGWKDDAAEGTIISGNYSVVGTETLGPAKIIGNLTIKNGANLILENTVHVTGNIIFETNASAALSAEYVNTGGVLISDGYIDLSNNVVFAGSGMPNSYLLLISTSNCPISVSCGGKNAIDVKNNVTTVILNAQSGTIHFSNNSGANAAVAGTLRLDNNATVTYESGLVDLSFSSGPSGGYEINFWGEVE